MDEGTNENLGKMHASDGEVLYSANKIAALVQPPVTPQTVRNWTRLEPGIVEKVQDGINLYRLSRVQQFAKDHGVGRVGGRRSGAGRPKRIKVEIAPQNKTVQAKAEDSTQQVAQSDGKIAEKTAAEGSPSGALAGEHEPEALVLPVLTTEELGRMSRAEADRHLRLVELAKKRTEFDQKRGALVEKADVDTAWGTALSQFALTVGNTGPSLAKRLAALLKLDSDQTTRVERVIADELESMLATLAKDPLGDLQAADIDEGGSGTAKTTPLTTEKAA